MGAKRKIHAIVRKLALSGIGVLLVSSELEEVRATADRIIAVLFRLRALIVLAVLIAVFSLSSAA